MSYAIFIDLFLFILENFSNYKLCSPCWFFIIVSSSLIYLDWSAIFLSLKSICSPELSLIGSKALFPDLDLDLALEANLFSALSLVSEQLLPSLSLLSEQGEESSALEYPFDFLMIDLLLFYAIYFCL